MSVNDGSRRGQFHVGTVFLLLASLVLRTTDSFSPLNCTASDGPANDCRGVPRRGTSGIVGESSGSSLRSNETVTVEAEGKNRTEEARGKAEGEWKALEKDGVVKSTAERAEEKLANEKFGDWDKKEGKAVKIENKDAVSTRLLWTGGTQVTEKLTTTTTPKMDGYEKNQRADDLPREDGTLDKKHEDRGPILGWILPADGLAEDQTGNVPSPWGNYRDDYRRDYYWRAREWSYYVEFPSELKLEDQRDAGWGEHAFRPFDGAADPYAGTVAIYSGPIQFPGRFSGESMSTEYHRISKEDEPPGYLWRSI